MKFDDFCARVILVVSLVLLLLGAWTSTSCAGGTPIVPAPKPELTTWQSPVYLYRAEAFPHDYIVGKEYKFVLMKGVSDAINPALNEFVVGLYTEDSALYPYNTDLHMVSVGDLYVNEEGGFTALDPGQKILKVEIRDTQDRLYATITFGPYFVYGSDWDSPVSRFNIEAQPSQYIVGQFYDMELIANMGDLVYRESHEIMIGLYRKSDEGAIFSDVLSLKFVPSGSSLYINEFGRFSADSTGQKTITTQVVDDEGHLYITVVFHPFFVSGGDVPPPPPPPPPSCRDLHPVKEAIDGFWWDCIDGSWENTGILVNPPSETYNLRVFGTLGEFSDGGMLEVEEGNGILLNHWELWPDGGGDKIFLATDDVQFESLVLPFWVWDSVQTELMTVLWVNPDYPDPDEPGNMFINPGDYSLSFEVSYDGETYTQSGILRVLDRLDFP